MITSLKELYIKYDFELSSLNKYIIYEKEILDIFENKNIDLYKYDKNLYIWIGNYYEHIEKDYDKMKKYYLMAIEMNNTDAMADMANYYQTTEINYDKMKEYYLMAVEMNHPIAMNNLGFYYQYIKIDYDKMKEYYLMAIELDNSIAMANLAVYYHNIEKDYNKMEEYFLRAIDLNNSVAMDNLATYYYNTKDYDKMKKYYLMAIELNNSKAMNRLASYYKNMDDKNNAIKYYLMAIKLNNSKAINNLKKITTPLQRYIYYKNNNIPFNEEITNDIHIYNNKLNISKNDTCYICYENDKTCILLNCFYHYTCTECYFNINDKPCPFCKL